MRLAAYLRLARPHHWVKNGFVLTGLLFGHALGDLMFGKDNVLHRAPHEARVGGGRRHGP